jgi:hypothetical protein
MQNMSEIISQKVLDVLDREIKWAFETRAQAESQSAVNYWSGYCSGLKRALELLLKLQHLK